MILDTLIGHYFISDPDKAMKFTQQGLALAQQIKFGKGEARFLRWKGIIHQRMGHYPEALYIFLQALKISQNINDRIEIALTQGSIGYLYSDQEDYSTAVKYFSESRKVSETTASAFAQASALMGLGETYFHLDKLDSALEFLQQSYYVSQRNKLDYVMDNQLKDIGQVQTKMNNDDEAMKDFRRSIPYSVTDSDHSCLNESFLGIAQLFQKKGQIDSCISYAKNLWLKGRQFFISKVFLPASQLLSYAYEGISEHEAFQFYKIAMAAKDSLFNAEKVKQVQNIGFIEQQRQQAIDATTLEYRNKIKLYTLVAVLIVFISIGIILLYNNKQKQKSKYFVAVPKGKSRIDFNRIKIRPNSAYPV